MYIAIVFISGCDVINFEINLIFLTETFSSMTENSSQIFEYLENEKRFYGEMKIFNKNY